jgi:hypothetical protein
MTRTQELLSTHHCERSMPHGIQLGVFVQFHWRSSSSQSVLLKSYFTAQAFTT